MTDEFDKAWREYAADSMDVPIRRERILAKGLIAALDERKALLKVLEAAEYWLKIEGRPVQLPVAISKAVDLRDAAENARKVIDGHQPSLDAQAPTD